MTILILALVIFIFGAQASIHNTRIGELEDRINFQEARLTALEIKVEEFHFGTFEESAKALGEIMERDNIKPGGTK